MAAGTFFAGVFGALLALLIALIVGEGPETDGFLAAYSVYLAFTLFGSTMRVALIPILGPATPEPEFRLQAANVLRRLMGAALVVSVAVLVLSPLLGRLLVPGASPSAQEAASISLAILAVASFLQIASATLSATLAAARRFAGSAALYVTSNVVTVTAGASLMLAFGIVGAAIGVFAGAAALYVSHYAYLGHFGFRVWPAVTTLVKPTTLRLLMLAGAGAAIPMAMQLNLTISLASLSHEVGAVTAYAYAYFIALLLSSLTAAAIGLVTMPDLVADLRARGRTAAYDYIARIGPMSIFLYVPLAVAYATFGKPPLEWLLDGPLSPGTVDLLWDASRVLLLMMLGWALLIPLTTLALSMGMYRGLAISAVSIVPVHAALVIPSSLVGPVTVAAAHAIGGTLLMVLALVLVFGRTALATIVRTVGASLPAGPLALVFPAIAMTGLADAGALGAVGAATLGLIAYAALAVVLWPAVGGRAVRLILRAPS